jgi:predicted nucleic acid-binding Zn ribbon protein
VNFRKSRPQRIDTVLEGVLEERGLRDQVRRWDVLEEWEEIVGEHVAEVTKARAVDDTTLIVEVATSAWLMELNMIKGEFLQRVNERLPDTPLERIVFVLAETS